MTEQETHTKEALHAAATAVGLKRVTAYVESDDHAEQRKRSKESERQEKHQARNNEAGVKVGNIPIWLEDYVKENFKKEGMTWKDAWQAFNKQFQGQIVGKQPIPEVKPAEPQPKPEAKPEAVKIPEGGSSQPKPPEQPRVEPTPRLPQPQPRLDARMNLLGLAGAFLVGLALGSLLPW